MEKLKLLLNLCDGLDSPDVDEENKKVEFIYGDNKDYVLIFDNVLQIMAIFLRFKLWSSMSKELGLIMNTIDVLVNDLEEAIQTTTLGSELWSKW